MKMMETILHKVKEAQMKPNHFSISRLVIIAWSVLYRVKPVIVLLQVVGHTEYACNVHD